jgi:hypothetical protein
MAIKYTFHSIERPCKINPNWNFWLENMPSGIPADVLKSLGENFRREKMETFLASLSNFTSSERSKI